MKVERAFRGVTTEVVWLTPLGVEARPAPGERYLVYGRSYRPFDIVMASPGHGAIAIERAAEHLSFLASLPPQASTGIISGVVQLKDRQYDGMFDRGQVSAGLDVAVTTELRKGELEVSGKTPTESAPVYAA